MTQYIYPQNLKATANLWLWGLKDFVMTALPVRTAAVTLSSPPATAPARTADCSSSLRKYDISSDFEITS